MTSSKTTQILPLQLVSGQSALDTEVRMLNQRLLQENGVIPNLYQKHKEAMKEIQAAKDKVTTAVDELKDKELKEHETKMGISKRKPLSCCGERLT